MLVWSPRAFPRAASPAGVFIMRDSVDSNRGSTEAATDDAHDPPAIRVDYLDPPARPLPDAVRLVCRGVGRHLFAAAMLTHPSGAAGRQIDVFISRTDDVSQHTLLALPDGYLLDVNGLRTPREVCRDLRLDASAAAFRETRPMRLVDPGTQAICRQIHQIANLSGWNAHAPRAQPSALHARDPRLIMQIRRDLPCHPSDVAGVVSHALGRMLGSAGPSPLG